MLLDILQEINWVDIFIVIILLRVVYVAMKNGLPVEIFKFLGTIVAIYLSMHYFYFLGDFLSLSTEGHGISLGVLDFIGFLVLVVVGYLIFVILRMFLCQLVKMETVTTLNKVGGLILGIVRGGILASLIVFILFISTVGYLRNSVSKSYLGIRLFPVAPAIYSNLWNGLMSKFMIKEKFNTTVTEIQESINQ